MAERRRRLHVQEAAVESCQLLHVLTPPGWPSVAASVAETNRVGRETGAAWCAATLLPVSDVEVPTDTDVGWLSPERLEQVRAQVPLVYVDAVPVRVDGAGRVTEVGMLLRVAADGSISRMVVSGRVLFGERVRDALMRHLEKDLGPMALPRLPADPTPFTVVEYFPDPDRRGSTTPAITPSAWPTSCRSTATASRRRRRSTWRGSAAPRRSARACGSR